MIGVTPRSVQYQHCTFVTYELNIAVGYTVYFINSPFISFEIEVGNKTGFSCLFCVYARHKPIMCIYILFFQLFNSGQILVLNFKDSPPTSSPGSHHCTSRWPRTLRWPGPPRPHQTWKSAMFVLINSGWLRIARSSKVSHLRASSLFDTASDENMGARKSSKKDIFMDHAFPTTWNGSIMLKA